MRSPRWGTQSPSSSGWSDGRKLRPGWCWLIAEPEHVLQALLEWNFHHYSSQKTPHSGSLSWKSPYPVWSTTKISQRDCSRARVPTRFGARHNNPGEMALGLEMRGQSLFCIHICYRFYSQCVRNKGNFVSFGARWYFPFTIEENVSAVNYWAFFKFQKLWLIVWKLLRIFWNYGSSK